MFLINEIRDPGCCKHLLRKISVLLQVTGDHRDLTVAAVFFTDKSGNPPGSFFHLFQRTRCGKHTDLILLLFIYVFPVTEDIFFQEMKSRGLGKPGFSHIFQKNRLLNISGQFRKSVDHLTAHVKKLIGLPSGT